MNLERTTVVLGSAVSAGGGGLLGVVRGVERLVREGRKVILVVPAEGWRHWRDVRRAEALGPASDPHARAIVLNGGALEAASNVSRALAEAGVSAALADPRRAAVVTRGHPLDAQPRHASARWFERQLERADVVVVAGGVGLDELRRPTHLGEDGASLTAVFLADAFALSLVALVEGSVGEGVSGRKARLLARDRGVGVTAWRVEGCERVVESKGAGPLRVLCERAVPA